MGFYHLDLDALAEYTGTPIEKLKQKSYADLDIMIKEMENDKIIRRNNRNAKDKEYERLVLKYFRPMNMLRYWFDDREVVLACARTGVTDYNLCDEAYLKPGSKCHYTNSEYIRTSYESVPQYDRWGRELMERARQEMDVYRVAAQYQGLHHGQVILHLLYQRYPGLAEFGFSAYEMSYDGYDYEIYPKNNIYTSLTALLSGDVDWILYRNREYCRSYNNGRYTTKECEKAFRTDEAQEMFRLITQIGTEEKKQGRTPIKADKDGIYTHAAGLVESMASESGDIRLFEKPKERSAGEKKHIFKLECAASYALYLFMCEFARMLDDASKVCVHIYHIDDYLGEHGITAEFQKEDERSVIPDIIGGKIFVNKDGFDCSGYVVRNAFGYRCGKKYDLTLRIDCPEIGK